MQKDIDETSRCSDGLDDKPGNQFGKHAERWKCVICGCTDDHACEGGCYWVYPNLCSACAEKLTGCNSERHIYPVSAGYGDTLIIEYPCILKTTEVSKLADSFRNAMLAQTDKRPGIIILDGGLHLVGIIHRHEICEQREGTRGE